jgi:hypothetical protein
MFQMLAGDGSEIVDIMRAVKPNAKAEVMFPASCNSLMESRKITSMGGTPPMCVLLVPTMPVSFIRGGENSEEGLHYFWKIFDFYFESSNFC